MSKKLRTFNSLKKIDEIDNIGIYTYALLLIRDNNEKINNILFDLTHLSYSQSSDYKKINEFILTSATQTQSVLDAWQILFPHIDKNV